MSHLREHKFKHNFQDCLNPICSCGLDIESTSHFLLHCPTFNGEQCTVLSILNKIYCELLELTNSSLPQTLLCGNTLFVKELKNKTLILNATIEYYPLKDSMGLFFSSFSLESLNPSKNFLNFFIIFTSYQILLHFFIFYFILRHFRILVPGDCDF